HADFGGPQGEKVVEQLTERLLQQKADLGLADIRSLTRPVGITQTIADPFKGLNIPKQARQEAVKRAARERYTTALGERNRVGTRLDLILVQNPFSQWSVDDLDRIEEAIQGALPSDMQRDGRLYVLGTTASVRDLARVTQE